MNDVGRRLRDVERQRLKLPPGADPLQTFEDGSPLGDTRFLDFGEGLIATLVGDDYVRVTGFAGSGAQMGWDAIVDSTLLASDPANRLFLGIGEALTYLRNVVGMLDRALVLVRPGAYTETSNWNSPPAVVLFGTEPAGKFTASDIEWDPGAFIATNNPHVAMFHMSVRPGASAANDWLGSIVDAYECQFYLSTSPTSHRMVNGIAILTRCYLERFRPLSGSVLRMSDCSVLSGTGSITMPTNFYATGLVISSATTGTLTLGTNTWLEIFGGLGEGAGITSGIVNLALADSSNVKYLYVNSQGSGGIGSVTMTGTGMAYYNLVGSFDNVTAIPAILGGHIAANIVSGSGFVDVTGPASIDVVLRASGTVTVRGTAVVGDIAAPDTASSGTLLSFVNGDQCQIDVAGSSTGGGTRKSYNFDASSVNNVLVFAGRSTYAVAGTDAGTNNRVLPEGAAPPAAGFAPADADYLVGTANGTLTSEIVVGTTPGGELGGTWAAPTVDATHSGSPHGVAIEDEGAAEGQALTVDFAGDGVSVGFAGTEATVTIPGVGTPTAGWGSITNVTVDRAYDADATTIDELSDVLATLIADLIAQGVIAT